MKKEVIEAFRRWGYLQSKIDPFGYLLPQPHPDLEITGETADQARHFYCGSIGVEFKHIPFPECCHWIQQRMESEPASPDRQFILNRLVRADILEQVLHTRYLGTKRFSLEGVDAVIPLLDEILEGAAGEGALEVVIGMSHRGRLNVMAHIVCKSPVEIFAGFEDVDPRSVLGGGDVKYHLGATGEYHTRKDQIIQVRLVSNPSHLEAVDPVALGRARSKQKRIGETGNRKILPILIHGEAAFAGQGITAETLNLSNLNGFSVGGTVHIIANNLLGFTAKPEELYSSRFSTDVAKRLPIPIFHVNADDPDAVVRAGRLALEYRYQFSSDVIVDLIGFRRHGHSEVDDPTITQPLLYQKIKDHPPLWKLYAEKIKSDPAEMVKNAREEYEEAKNKATTVEKIPRLGTLPAYWSSYKGGRYDPSYEVETGVANETILQITDSLSQIPENFSVHPKVQRLLDQRLKMGRGEIPVDFGMAETLAFGSLLQQGIPVRLCGQDSRRGTFSQRHSVLIDVKNENEYLPLSHVYPDQAWFEVYNTVLSEVASLGFEYGFSRDYPEALVLWEAQFGDFANGAQVIIDQFISAGEDKWDLLSGLVLLLPHGYEGQGPEHSSARIERFLQLAAEDNFQVCQPSTAAQYFHLLRRQALRRWRKPLIVFTPKSMLRHPDASSSIGEFSQPNFRGVIAYPPAENAKRLLICSGKIGHELKRERERRGDNTTGIIFLEQLYPFPEDELVVELNRYAEARELIWVQEEPANMGSLFYVLPWLEQVAGGRSVRSVKRSASASPATGSAKAHELEQKTLLTLAFTT